ncbi:hypothetical protein [Haloarcula sediminis]|uniref:hypothetical protein n=1 Tax=Haloarcula sediminis TaxID=3111777 RepID=UPI002D76761C|nr:hypothetical protein [Haloarcula sp. CK38]
MSDDIDETWDAERSSSSTTDTPALPERTDSHQETDSATESANDHGRPSRARDRPGRDEQSGPSTNEEETPEGSGVADSESNRARVSRPHDWQHDVGQSESDWSDRDSLARHDASRDTSIDGGDTTDSDSPASEEYSTEFSLYSSNGDLVASTARTAASTDVRIGQYFDDQLRAYIEIEGTTNTVVITSHVRARASRRGRIKTYYVRFEYDPEMGIGTVHSELKRFLSESAGVLLADTDDSQNEIIADLASMSDRTTVDEGTVSILAKALGEESRCLKFTVPGERVGFEHALALLSDTPAQSVAISRTDHHLDEDDLDALLYVRQGNEIALLEDTQALVEEYRAKLNAERARTHLDAIGDEVRALQQHTQLSDVAIRRQAERQLPAVSVRQRLSDRVSQLREGLPAIPLVDGVVSNSRSEVRDGTTAHPVRASDAVQSRQGPKTNRSHEPRVLIPVIGALVAAVLALGLWTTEIGSLLTRGPAVATRLRRAVISGATTQLSMPGIGLPVAAWELCLVGVGVVLVLVVTLWKVRSRDRDPRSRL